MLESGVPTGDSIAALRTLRLRSRSRHHRVRLHVASNVVGVPKRRREALDISRAVGDQRVHVGVVGQTRRLSSGKQLRGMRLRAFLGASWVVWRVELGLGLRGLLK